MKHKKILILGNLLLAMVFMVNRLPAECPYSIENMKIRREAIKDCCEYGALLFTLENNSSKNMTEFDVVIVVTDEDGNNPFSAGNTIISKVQNNIKCGDYINLFLPLDSFLADCEEEKLFIESIFVRRILYEDGSQWRDLYGIYSLGESR